MMLGMWCGQWLKTLALDRREAEGPRRRGRGADAGRASLLQWLHICPIVKRIWTSSYTLYSGGLVVLMLAGFYAVIEWQGLAALGVSAAGDRRQLDRDLRHELDDRALCVVGPPPARRRGAICDSWRPVRAGAAWHCGPARVLDDPVLDVPAEDLFEDLKPQRDGLNKRRDRGVRRDSNSPLPPSRPRR